MHSASIDISSVISQETMLKWNDMFPSSDHEKRRNELIYEVQGTLNGFVDDACALTELMAVEGGYLGW